MAWWEAYGLIADPMMNHPVPKGSHHLLVRTPVVEELAAYMAASRARGGIYLVNGDYGSGKTSILNSLGHLASGAAYDVFYADVSVHKTTESLVTFFQNDLLPRFQASVLNKKQPIAALV